MGIFLLPNLAYLSAITPEKLIELTNLERQAAGLKPLTANQLLAQAAYLKGQAIINSQTFAHSINDKKFSSWIRDTGYNYSYAGENLAIDFSASESVIRAWENSPLHKKNLLSPYYGEIGIAAVEGNFHGQNTTVVVQIFGAPAASAARPIARNYESTLLNLNPSAPAAGFSGYQYARPENLFTHSVSAGEFAATAETKMPLPRSAENSAPANNFFVQFQFYPEARNFITIFSLSLIISLIAFSYRRFFLIINKLASI
ncbi:MAG: CAP domain-containing protein [bacterium]|nr:CAP domain-containing protein [bacterium]